MTYINTVCLKKRTPKLFIINIVKTALMSIKIGTHNLHIMRLNYNY